MACDETSPAVPCAVGFDPAHAGGDAPSGSALPEGYRLAAQDGDPPFIKVLAQNPKSASRTRQVRRNHTILRWEDNTPYAAIATAI